MAGTPTPNYQFPTYAESDTPNLAGAYNQAVNAIDAKIKEVADSVSSGGDVPDATSTTKGIAKLYDSATVGACNQDDGGITPKAIKDYVDAKVATEQQAYTGTTPITVDNDSRTIGIRRGAQIQNTNIDEFIGQTSEMRNAKLTPVFSVADVDAYNKILANNDAEHGWPDGHTAPTCTVMNSAIKAATRDASTSVKGLVQLAETLNTTKADKALTGKAFRFADGIYNSSSRALTVADLSRLMVNEATGLVYLGNSNSE